MWKFRLILLSRRCCSSATAPIRERMVDRWKIYWKNLLSDYSTVAKDIITDSRERPIKAMTILSIAVAAGYCASHNPDETNFTDKLLNYSADLGTVSSELHNQDSAEHVMRLRNIFNERRLLRQNLLLCSVLYLDDNSQYCCTYDAKCSYLKSSIIQLVNRIVDIGFLDKWWILDKNMENYDVNY